MITAYKLTRYFDPMGDKKSERKKHSASIIFTEKSKEEIEKQYEESNKKYYGTSVKFGNWKKRN